MRNFIGLWLAASLLGACGQNEPAACANRESELFWPGEVSDSIDRNSLAYREALNRRALAVCYEQELRGQLEIGADPTDATEQAILLCNGSRTSAAHAQADLALSYTLNDEEFTEAVSKGYFDRYTSAISDEQRARAIQEANSVIDEMIRAIDARLPTYQRCAAIRAAA